ncbi:MAG: aldehyde ferredoxin oxidoreductase family protein [Promethearchaeota archaeon]
MSKMFGWHGHILRVNLSSMKIKNETVSKEILMDYIGGRGLGIKYLFEELDPKVDPLSPLNKIFIGTGPATGTNIPSSNRFSASFKSPLTGTIFDCNAGGAFAPALKGCGFDAIIIEGKLSSPGYLHVSPDGAEIKEDESSWGLSVLETSKILKKRHGDSLHSCIIGPAGENKVLYANMMVDENHALGRGGLGAVAGSKNLKAIVVSPGKGDEVKKAAIQDPGMLKIIFKEINKRINASPVTGKGLRYFGTAQLVNLMNAMGLFPVNNFQQGMDPRAKNLSGEAIRDEIFQHKEACYGCPIGCGRITKISNGRTGKGPEYESDWALGADCGIFDLEKVTAANYDCNEMGLDTISCGATLACAMELNEKGKLGTEWQDFKFGNKDLLKDIIKKISRKEGVGELLSLGSKNLAEKFGMPEFAMQVKGLEIPAYDPRGAYGMALAYATSNRGACHLRAYTIGAELLGLPKMFNRFSFSDKPDLVVKLQNFHAFYDSIIACKFTGMGVPEDYYARAISAVIGVEISETDAERIGERIYNLERLFNCKAGFGKEDDSLPPRFSQPLESGASKGKVPPLDIMLGMYYEIRGWTQDGHPTEEKLKEMGLK